jgi:hypothetical protein
MFAFEWSRKKELYLQTPAIISQILRNAKYKNENAQAEKISCTQEK